VSNSLPKISESSPNNHNSSRSQNKQVKYFQVKLTPSATNFWASWTPTSRIYQEK